jgi:hypothetical protein
VAEALHQGLGVLAEGARARRAAGVGHPQRAERPCVLVAAASAGGGAEQP